jgi:hypothetical protein
VGAGRKVHGGLQQRSYRVPFVEIIGAHSSVEATDEISMSASMFAWVIFGLGRFLRSR